MKEYEIYNNDKIVGKIKLFNNSSELEDAFISSLESCSYHILNNSDYQTYELTFILDSVDDLYDIVSKYKNDNIFETIEEIKKYNNIKNIKKNSEIKVVVPEIFLNKFNINKNNVDLLSLFQSKVYFIKKVLEINDFVEIKDKLRALVNDYNNFVNNVEYDFYTDEEKKNKISYYLGKVDELIKSIELNTIYKYGKDFVIPIKAFKD